MTRIPATYARATNQKKRDEQEDSPAVLRDRGAELARSHAGWRGVADGEGHILVLLLRTPYDKLRPGTVADAQALTARGYIVVNQDTRGRHASEGKRR